MGWSTGSAIFTQMIEVLVEHVDEGTRQRLYEEFIPIFESFDCDTLDECMGIDVVFDKMMESSFDDDEDAWDDDDFGDLNFNGDFSDD